MKYFESEMDVKTIAGDAGGLNTLLLLGGGSSMSLLEQCAKYLIKIKEEEKRTTNLRRYIRVE